MDAEAPLPPFGVRQEGVAYRERSAAYAVLLGGRDTVAVVRGPAGRCWLPGGGCLPGESAEETVAREVREELGREIRLVQPAGQAIQFFYAANEGRHYRMRAWFFRAGLADGLAIPAGHELAWLPLPQAKMDFFHECHGWAVDRAVGLVRPP